MIKQIVTELSTKITPLTIFGNYKADQMDEWLMSIADRLEEYDKARINKKFIPKKRSSKI